MERKQVGILIFDEVEVLDFSGPYEVFAATRLNEATRQEEPSPFRVFLVAEQKLAVSCNGGMQVVPDCALDECPKLDILVLPGGYGTRKAMKNESLLAWISECSRQVSTLASVCTGSLLLGAAGLLEGRRATTHWRVLDWMQELFPSTTVDRRLHVVEDGNLITSAGISAGIDMALRVVERYFGEAVARATAKYMEYPFPESDARRIRIE